MWCIDCIRQPDDKHPRLFHVLIMGFLIVVCCFIDIYEGAIRLLVTVTLHN